MLDLKEEVFSFESDNSIRTFFKHYNFSNLSIEEIADAIKDLYLKLKKMRIHKKMSNYEELNHHLSKLLETEVKIDNITIHETYEINEKGAYLSQKRESQKINLPQMHGITETIITHYDEKEDITELKRILEGEGVTLFSAISTKKDGIFDKIETNLYQGKPFLTKEQIEKFKKT